ncbi:MAG: SPOR domain-containing protein, partial [Bacteroidota bacterium]
SKPIPVDNKFPDGIVFTIQVGAFKTIVPNKTFKGLNPVNGTKTANGFIRYQAGLFNNYNEANAAKNDLKKMGFKDAFIAVYKNNVRVSLNEILGELNEKIENNESTSVGINNSRNIPDGTQILNNDNNIGNANLVTTPVEKISGLFYTVQIGLYSGTPSEKQLFYLKPIQNEAFNTGNYRYMAGIYNKLERVRTDATKVKALGISDAFICAYSKGKRVKISEIQGKENNPNFIFESEKPIEFRSEKNTETLTVKTDTIKKVINDANINIDSKIIFSNGVNKEPDPTPENGVKLSTEGITYKIQIGAYSKAVPNSVSENWSKIKNWPVRNFTNNSNLIIYNVGSFGDFQNAKKLLFEIKDLGVEDAFITVFKDGVRLSGEQATQYTR